MSLYRPPPRNRMQSMAARMVPAVTDCMNRYDVNLSFPSADGVSRFRGGSPASARARSDAVPRDGTAPRPCVLFLGVRSRSILFIHIPPAPVYCPGRANMSDSRIIQKHVRTDGKPARTGRAGAAGRGWEAGRPRGRKAGPAGCAVKANRIAALRRRQTGKPGRAQEPKPGRRWPKTGRTRAGADHPPGGAAI